MSRTVIPNRADWGTFDLLNGVGFVNGQWATLLHTDLLAGTVLSYSGSYIAPSSPVADDIRQSPAGILSGSALWQHRNGFYDLDLAGGYVQGPNLAGRNLEQAFTIWFWYRGSVSANVEDLVSTPGDAITLRASNFNDTMQLQTNGPVGGFVPTNLTGLGFVSEDRPLMATYDGTDQVLRVDDQVGTNSRPPGALAPFGDLVIGRYQNLVSNDYIGLLDNFVIWDRALSEDDYTRLISIGRDGLFKARIQPTVFAQLGPPILSLGTATAEATAAPIGLTASASLALKPVVADAKALPLGLVPTTDLPLGTAQADAKANPMGIVSGLAINLGTAIARATTRPVGLATSSVFDLGTATATARTRPLPITIGAPPLALKIATAEATATAIGILTGESTLDLGTATASAKASPITLNTGTVLDLGTATAEALALPLPLAPGESALALGQAIASAKAAPMALGRTITLGTATASAKTEPLGLAQSIQFVLGTAKATAATRPMPLVVSGAAFTLGTATAQATAAPLGIEQGLKLGTAVADAIATPLGITRSESFQLAIATAVAEANAIGLIQGGPVFALGQAVALAKAAPIRLQLSTAFERPILTQWRRDDPVLTQWRLDQPVLTEWSED